MSKSQGRVMFYKRVPYAQRYLFNANPDTNHDATPTNLFMYFCNV